MLDRGLLPTDFGGLLSVVPKIRLGRLLLQMG
jgi:hypothetical protein